MFTRLDAKTEGEKVLLRNLLQVSETFVVGCTWYRKSLLQVMVHMLKKRFVEGTYIFKWHYTV